MYRYVESREHVKLLLGREECDLYWLVVTAAAMVVSDNDSDDDRMVSMISVMTHPPP